MLYCMIATSGPTPFSSCRPAPMRLYMARLALMIQAFIVSLLGVFVVSGDAEVGFAG